MEIGQTIKANREKMQLSQNQLAEKLFISRQSISKWENGKSLPSFENVIALSEILAVSLDELIKSDDKMIEKIKQPNKLDRIIEVFSIAIFSAIILSLIFNQLFGLAETNIAWIAAPIFLITLITFFYNLNWRYLEKAFNKKAFVALIIMFSLYLWPSIYSFMSGFIDGLIGK